MHKIDSSNAVSVMPTPNAPGTGGWFAHGTPGGTPYTVVTSDWCNAVQGEIMNVITAAGLTLDKTSQSQLLAAIQSLGRIKLTANTNLYISPTGSDSNNGLTAGTPMRTAKAAYQFAYNTYDFNGHTVFVNYAAGTYNGANDCTTVVGPAPGWGAITFLGNTSNPASVIVTPSVAGNCFCASNGATINVQGIQMGNSHGSSSLGSVPGDCLVATLCGSIGFNQVIFSGTQRAHMETGNGGTIICSQGGTYTIAGGADFHTISGIGEIAIPLSTVTVTGTPAFGQAFAWSEASGYQYWAGTTITGSATGQRYLATNGGVIGTGGGGANYFPGNVAGVSTNGYYS